MEPLHTYSRRFLDTIDTCMIFPYTVITSFVDWDVRLLEFILVDLNSFALKMLNLIGKLFEGRKII